MTYRQLAANEFLEKAHGIILDHLSNDQFGVSEMALELGISRASLYRKIKTFSGLSCSEYIRKVKLGMALELLENSTANVTEIAFECGFKSLSYFHTCFKKHFGRTPGEIRKNNNAQVYKHTNGNEIAGKGMHSFPVFHGKFIGRASELGEIRKLIKEYRIISLTGPGGCGKTRLACEVAMTIDNGFLDGIWFVDLAPVETPDLLVKAILESLRIPEAPGLEMLDTLKNRIFGKNLLLVLDNCEHLVAGCAELTKILSESCPGLKILITSRCILGIKGETVWTVPSLSLKNPDQIKDVNEAASSDAVLLFADRARMSDYRFELSHSNIRDIASICKKVDGIPLALELVANRIRFMDPEQILHRFSGSFLEVQSTDSATIDRQMTMKATIDWSYNLLTDEEKQLIKRLSVFSGGFDLEAVYEVCSGKAISGEYLVDLLANLVDRSMVNTHRVPDQPLRYQVHETTRQYAAGLLDIKEFRQLKKRHLNYYICIAEEAFNHRNLSQKYWLDRLSREHENMLAALNWSEENQVVQYQRLTGFLAWYWARSNKYYLARHKLADLLKNPNLPKDTRAQALAGYGWSMFGQINDASVLIESAKEMIDIWKGLGNKREEITTRAEMSAIYFGWGQDEAGLESVLETYEEAKELDNSGVSLICKMWVAQGYLGTRRIDEARTVLLEVLELADELDHIFAKALGHANYACCDLLEGKFEESEREFWKGVELSGEYGDVHYLYTYLAGMAMSAAGMGQHARAIRLISGINLAARESGNMPPELNPIAFWQEQMKLHIGGSRAKLGEKLTRRYEDEGAAMELEEVIHYAQN